MQITNIPKETWNELSFLLGEWSEKASTPASKVFLECMQRQLAPTFKSDPPWDTVFVCSNASEEIQSIAMYDSTKRHLYKIASLPEKTVRGSGKHLITYLAKHALSQDSSLTVDPLSESRSFYEQLGFTKDPENPSYRMIWGTQTKTTLDIFYNTRDM